jgi:hypothetical protein
MVRSDCAIIALRSLRSPLPYLCDPTKSNTAQLDFWSVSAIAAALQPIREEMDRDEYQPPLEKHVIKHVREYS